MADKITSCVVTKDASDNPIQYDVAYEVESGEKTNQYCITIKAEDMDDATDTAEVTSKANTAAKEIKDAWVADMVTVTNADVAIDGDVTL